MRADEVLIIATVAAHRPHHVQPDLEFWSANRAEHRFANGYELVVFDLPAANGYPATIGWELFNGPDPTTLARGFPSAHSSPPGRYFVRWPQGRRHN